MQLSDFLRPATTEEHSGKVLCVPQDLRHKAIIATGSKKVPNSVIEVEDLIVPFVSYQGAIQCDDADRAKPTIASILTRNIELEFFKILTSAVPSDHSQSCFGQIDLDRSHLAMTMLEEHELFCTACFVHPDAQEQLLGSVPKYLETKVHVFDACPKNAIYFVAAPHDLGVFSEKPVRAWSGPDEDGNMIQVLEQEVAMAISMEVAVSRILRY
jgi:hypothetical protein